MSLNASNAGGTLPDIPVLEAATYPGRLLSVVDLGLQEQRPYMGKEKPPIHKILLSYEFSDEFMPDEDGEEDRSKPRVLSEQIALHNLSADLATSTKRYKAMDATLEHKGDFAALVGRPVNITVVANVSTSNGKTYNNIGGISPMRAKEAANLPFPVNPTSVFDLDAPDMDVFNDLYKWQQDIIIGNLEFAGSALEAKLAADPAYQDIKETSSGPAPAPAEAHVEADVEDDIPF